MGGSITCCVKSSTSSTTYHSPTMPLNPPPPPPTMINVPPIHLPTMPLTTINPINMPTQPSAPPPPYNLIITQDFTWYNDVPDNIKFSIADNYVCACISAALGKGWQLMLLQLGMTQKHIDNAMDNSPRSTSMAIYKVLISWYRKYYEEATVDALMKAIIDQSVNVDMEKLKTFVEIMLPEYVNRDF